MRSPYRFNLLELSGSLGDLGTLLPLAIGMIMINGLSPAGVLLTVGLYYVMSGLYFGVTVPVQPMKVIGAYAVATAVSASQLMAAGLLIGVFLLVIGATGLMTIIGRYIPKQVVRGVQVATGTLLIGQGVKFIMGSSSFQVAQAAAEPYLTLQHLGPIPIGIVFGIIGGITTLWFLNNKRFPAGLIVVLAGLVLGLFLGTRQGFDTLRLGLYLPGWLPFGLPSWTDLSLACLILVFPQIPMTLGNAVMAYVDLSHQYFGEQSQRVTYKASCISMGLVNLLCASVGGMPLCHGAGGLAAHYRFGARTPGSNLLIGFVFVGLALFLGEHALSIIYLISLSVLGVLLIYSGTQLAMTLIDMRTRRELFVVFVMLGITLAVNLAVGFIAGIGLAYLLKSERLSV